MEEESKEQIKQLQQTHKQMSSRTVVTVSQFNWTKNGSRLAGYNVSDQGLKKGDSNEEFERNMI